MRIFDTHAHLLDKAYDQDREQLLQLIKLQGVALVMEAGTKAEELPSLLGFIEGQDFIYGAAGIHPEEIGGSRREDLFEIEKALSHPKIKAVGEIGLDYHYDDNAPKDIQKDFFDAQLSLAEQYRLPVLIHDRDAHGDCLDIVKAHRGLRGVMHCFSGSYELAKSYADLGFYLGFGGVVTFKNARKTKECVQKLPLDSLLTETDCPYMAPEPFRGTRNHPGNIRYVLEQVALLRGMEAEILSETLFENGKKLFAL